MANDAIPVPQEFLEALRASTVRVSGKMATVAISKIFIGERALTQTGKPKRMVTAIITHPESGAEFRLKQLLVGEEKAIVMADRLAEYLHQQSCLAVFNPGKVTASRYMWRGEERTDQELPLGEFCQFIPNGTALAIDLASGVGLPSPAQKSEQELIGAAAGVTGMLSDDDSGLD